MNNKILSFISNAERGADFTLKTIAANVRARRLEQNITQKAFAAKVGMPLPTYRRFETSGEISLRKLVAIADALDSADELERLFTKRHYSSLEEVLKQGKPRKRASSND